MRRAIPLLLPGLIVTLLGARPKLTAQKGEVQTRLEAEDLAGQVGLLSITVDPEGDTPERLAEYASRAEARSGRWIFLTGEDDFSIIHGGKLVLVDAGGTSRGYYEADEVDAITRAALALASEADRS